MKLALFGIVCATVGWWMGAAPPQGGLDGTWARTRMHRREMLALCRVNLENQFTPGYKAYQTAFDFDEALRPTLNMGQGEVFKTQTPLNVALNGPGFFALEGGVYTRDGRLCWRNGLLCTSQGRAVLGTQGPLQQGNYANYHFGEQGVLYGEDCLVDPVTGQRLCTAKPLGQLIVVTFDNPELLARSGATAFTPTREAGPARPQADPVVCPGSLELANVDFVVEGGVIARLSGSSVPMAPLGILGNVGKSIGWGKDPMQLGR